MEIRGKRFLTASDLFVFFQRFIDLDQMPIWVAEVSGADTPIGMVGRFGEQGHAVLTQMFAELVHAFDGEGQADSILHLCLHGLGGCAERGAHFGFVEQRDVDRADLKIGVGVVFCAEVRFEAHRIAIKAEAGFEVCDEKAGEFVFWGHGNVPIDLAF